LQIGTIFFRICQVNSNFLAKMPEPTLAQLSDRSIKFRNVKLGSLTLRDFLDYLHFGHTDRASAVSIVQVFQMENGLSRLRIVDLPARRIMLSKGNQSFI
jgi:hypothetical protein